MARTHLIILITLLLSCGLAMAEPAPPDEPQSTPPIIAQADAEPPATMPPETPPEAESEAPAPTEAPDAVEPADAPEWAEPAEEPEPAGTAEPGEASGVEETDPAGIPEHVEVAGETEAAPDAAEPEPPAEIMEAPADEAPPEPPAEIDAPLPEEAPTEPRPDLSTALSFSQERAVSLRYDWNVEAGAWSADPVYERVAVYVTNVSDRTLTGVYIQSSTDAAIDRGGLYHLVFALTRSDPLTIDPGETIEIGTFTFQSEGGTTSEAEPGALHIALRGEYAD